MEIPNSISDYLRAWAGELGARIVEMDPALYTVSDASSPLIGTMFCETLAGSQGGCGHR